MYFYLARACHSENVSVIILLSFLIFWYFIQGLQSTVEVEQRSLSCERKKKGKKKRKKSSLGAVLSLSFSLFFCHREHTKRNKKEGSTPFPVVKRYFRNKGRNPWEWLCICLFSNWLSLIVWVKPFQCQDTSPEQATKAKAWVFSCKAMNDIWLKRPRVLDMIENSVSKNAATTEHSEFLDRQM